MSPQHIPNFITCLRILLIGPVLWGLLSANYPLALFAFILAGCSDALDGFLARHYGWTSRFGSIVDPLADKLLLMSSFAMLTWLGYIPVWLLIAVVGRDLWIMCGVIAYHCLVGQPQFTPSLTSKLNTFLQILLITLLLLQLSYATFPGLLIGVVMYLVLLTSLASFIHYTGVWGRRAWLNRRQFLYGR